MKNKINSIIILTLITCINSYSQVKLLGLNKNKKEVQYQFYENVNINTHYNIYGVHNIINDNKSIGIVKERNLYLESYKYYRVVFINGYLNSFNLNNCFISTLSNNAVAYQIMGDYIFIFENSVPERKRIKKVY